MRNVFTNTDVAKVWVRGEQMRGRNRNRSLYFDGDIIYSYHDSFPVALRRKDDEIIKYLFNSDRYGCTTTNHQSLVRSAVGYEVPVAYLHFGMLKKAGIIRDSIKSIDVKIKDGNSWYRYDMNGSYLFEAKSESTVEWERGNETGIYLFGNDSSAVFWDAFFLAELMEENLTTVDQAYRSLLPDNLMYDDIELLRQGEWFFVKADGKELIKINRKLRDGSYEEVKWYMMRHPNSGKNYGTHRVTRAIVDGGIVYAKGTCRHNKTCTSDPTIHQMLKLDDWHKMYPNRQKRSFR